MSGVRLQFGSSLKVLFIDEEGQREGRNGGRPPGEDAEGGREAETSPSAVNDVTSYSL